MENYKVLELAYRYVLSMSKTKKFNPQTIANINILKEYGLKGIKNEMEKDIREFCEANSVKKLVILYIKMITLRPEICI